MPLKTGIPVLQGGEDVKFRKVLCPHCRGKLEPGQRIHSEGIAPWADAQAEKAKRAEAKMARAAAKVERASIKAGMTAEQALFCPKVTHNGRKPKPYEPKTHAKHERSNSVAITCNGKTLTAAEWAREPGVTVSRAGLIWRLRQGWEPSRALFQQGRFA